MKEESGVTEKREEKLFSSTGGYAFESAERVHATQRRRIGDGSEKKEGDG